MWIEIVFHRPPARMSWSRPARALWIEIPERAFNGIIKGVEAREGLVD